MNHEGCSNSLSEECTAFHRFSTLHSLVGLFNLSSEILAKMAETTRRSPVSPATTRLARVTLSRPILTLRSPTRSTCSCSSSPWPSSSAHASSVSSAPGLSQLTSKVKRCVVFYLNTYLGPHALARLPIITTINMIIIYYDMIYEIYKCIIICI